MPAEVTPFRVEIPRADAAGLGERPPELFVNEICAFFGLIC
jgi:hypothetical protein